MKALVRSLGAAVDFLLPAGCAACGAWIPGGMARAPLACASCQGSLRPPPWPRCGRCHHPVGPGRRETPCRGCAEWPRHLSGSRYAFVLGSAASRMVHELKYGDWPELAEPMAAAMAELKIPEPAPTAGNGPGAARRVVTFVPAVPERERARGYNQARLLAHHYASLLELPVRELLRRPGPAVSQTALGMSERFRNVRNAFRSTDEVRAWRGAHAILIDYVLTTGATAVAASSELVRSGAGRVTLVAFARSLPERTRLRA